MFLVAACTGHIEADCPLLKEEGKTGVPTKTLAVESFTSVAESLPSNSINLDEAWRPGFQAGLREAELASLRAAGTFSETFFADLEQPPAKMPLCAFGYDEGGELDPAVRIAEMARDEALFYRGTQPVNSQL